MEESKGFAAPPPERPKVLGPAKHPALFMANVPLDTTQNDVYNHFTKEKDIKISRVEMQLSGNASLGIEKQKLNAIIHFYDHDEADRVLQYYKIQRFKDRQYCLTWYEPQPNKERREWNLFVEGLPPSWGSQEFIQEFSPFGSIVSCKIHDAKASGAASFGWIQYEEQKAAQEAIEELNDKIVTDLKTEKEYKLSISYYNSHKSCSVYVSNIPHSVFNEQSLISLFSDFGKVNSVSLLRTKIPPSAFVNFETAEAAQKAIAEGKSLALPDDNRGPLYVSPQFTKKELARHNQQIAHQRGGEESKGQAYSAPAAKTYNDSNLFVRPIPEDVGESEVREVFQKYGEVQSILIRNFHNDPTSRKAFVLFANTDQAFKAIKALDGTKVWNVFLSVKPYESPGQRRKQYQQSPQAAEIQNPITMFFSLMQYMMMNQGPHQRHHPIRNNYGGGSGYSHQNTYQGDHLPGADYNYRGRGRGNYNRGMQQRGGRDMRGNAGRGRRAGHGGAYHGGQLPGPPPQSIPQHIHQQQLPQHQPQVQQAPPLPQPYQAQPPVVAEVQTEASLTAELNAMPQDERRQYIGNRIFAEVQKRMPLNAGKITGMLVDLSPEQIAALLMRPDELNNIIDQAYQQLRTSGLLVADESPVMTGQ